ncbi:DUF2306 domain-containing protein [Marinomonas fungiae]|uniref:Uncharacterized membrane protein n=1 Tax=Marinomonas fungiae TaxID=1137284 RepID=A0A0K6IL19_9GAMM|nr:DUF2306 domain-containing protein [Marinomonas fungiae]CUB03779.1 Uncharacterized membrane protein [Marinomonas fungiae]
MTYLQLAYLHLATVIPPFLIGAFILLAKKGTPRHKRLGKLYMVFMMLTAIISLLMPAQIGPTLLGHFGFIHLFSMLVLLCIPLGLIAIRRNNLRAHIGNMIGVYLGGIIIAGAFAFMPGRLLHSWMFM